MRLLASVATWVVLLSTVFVGLTQVIGLDGSAYSPVAHYRFQTEAFFRGTFALQEFPTKQMADWAWANGFQQVWGLGVPLLRLPFEALARAVDLSAFPDRWVFVLMFIGTAAALIAGLRAHVGSVPRAAALSWILLLNPVFVTMVGFRFNVYEEAVAYGYLWALLCLGTAARAIGRSNATAVLALGAMAGFSVFIRPTIGLYAVTALALAIWNGLRGGWLPARKASGAVALTLTGFGLLALTNWMRFGSPVEFGHRLNTIGWPLKVFALKFGHPFADEPLVSAARELFAALFLRPKLNATEYYATGVHPWFSQTLRSREYYFETFGAIDLVALGIAFGALLVAAWARIRRPDRQAPGTALDRLLHAWSWPALVVLFAFYLRAPSINSRYLVDFAPAVYGLFAALALAAWRWIDRRAPVRARPYAIALIGAALPIWTLTVWALQSPTGNKSNTAAVPVSRIWRQPPGLFDTAPILPDVYRCPGKAPSFKNIYTGGGWRMKSTCEVEAATHFYFKDVRCITLELASTYEETPDAFRARLQAVRVKVGIEYLELRESRELASRTSELTFCSKPDRPQVWPGYQFVFIGVVDPARLDQAPATGFKLLSVARVP